jgi:hypothetical protein
MFAHRAVPGALLVLIAAAALDAQTIRGTVVDDASKLPIPGVAITLLDATGTEIRPGVRSDTLGSFTIHAARAGTWRVKGMRIGYSPVTSDPVQLTIGGLTVVRLRLTPVAQELVPVQVVERRRLSASELMSTMGFDLRESRGLGRFLGGQRLADMGREGVGEILARDFQPVLYVSNDSVLGDVLRLRQGGRSCSPEIFLDGRLLAAAPESLAASTGIPPLSAMDSVRAQTRAEAERFRRGSDQMNAFALLSSFRANQLHGIEVYRANEVPPASLGAWFGMTMTAIRTCGTVAVWTKAGALSLATRRRTTTGRVIQVVSGTLVDFDTGKPVAGRNVYLLTEAKDLVVKPVVTDERGDFTFRTTRAGVLRLRSGGDGYLTSTSPTFEVTPNEMVVVKLFVSAREGLLAPLGVAARVLPQNVGLTSMSGFTYRRERAQAGSFLDSRDIERTGAASLADLVRTVRGVAITNKPSPGTIALSRGETLTCAPAFYVDGVLIGDAATIAALSPDRVFGVEVYTTEAEIPSVFSDARGCGAIVVWMKP